MTVQKIAFGTDGWRAIIADDFTVENVMRVAEGTALRIIQDLAKPTIVIGHDCRFGGRLFAETAARVFCKHGIQVLFSEGITSTPMVSLGIVTHKADLGVVITASHNPPSYNGYKLKGKFGGPSSPSFVAEVEALIPEFNNSTYDTFQQGISNGLIKFVDLEGEYITHVNQNFDLNAIENSGMNLAYDAMYGAGQNVIRKVFPEATLLHCDWNPGFDGQAPEPIHKNLKEFSEVIRLSEDIASGLATDGDADRIGLYDEKGNFVDSHHIILLLIKYLVQTKGFSGKVVKSFSCTGKIDALCEKYGLKSETTKIGFKYICEIMTQEDVLVGAEESGGIAIKGHIPERDGIWIGITIWEMMAKSGKSLSELIQEVYNEIGSFAVERYDEHVSHDVKKHIVEQCKANTIKAFGPYQVVSVEDLDGYKFHFNNGSWVMLRPSGTEPVLRIYAEAADSKAAFDILDAVKAAMIPA